MIYTRNGKLLVTPSGKLGICCNGCEPDDLPSIVTVEFSNLTYKSGWENCCIPEELSFELEYGQHGYYWWWEYHFYQASPYIEIIVRYKPDATGARLELTTNWADGTCPTNPENSGACKIFDKRVNDPCKCPRVFILDGSESCAADAGGRGDVSW